MAALLDVKNLGISFGGLRAVNGFDISIEQGELYGLIGPNGAGKTTVFNLLTGVYKPDTGKIILDGKDIIKWALKLSASAIILVHNHPSGDSTPSRADIEMTKKLFKMAQIFDIELLDHIVIGNMNFTSIISKLLTKDGEI